MEKGLENEIKLYDKELKNREFIINNYKSNIVNELKNVDISKVTKITKKKKTFLQKLFSAFK